MTDWFRSWHGAPTDSKWLVVARKAGVAPGIVSAIVWALFDHASQSGERGSVDGFDVETYACFSGFSEDEITSVINALRDKQLIVNGRLSAWERRQPKREDNSTERVRGFRAKAKHNGPDPGPKGGVGTHSNTLQRDETQRNAPEQNRAEEKSSLSGRLRDDDDDARNDVSCEPGGRPSPSAPATPADGASSGDVETALTMLVTQGGGLSGHDRRKLADAVRTRTDINDPVAYVLQGIDNALAADVRASPPKRKQKTKKHEPELSDADALRAELIAAGVRS